eukprot:scaffold5.g614.t1
MSEHFRYQQHVEELQRKIVSLSEQQRALQDEIDPQAAAEFRRRLAGAQRAAALRDAGLSAAVGAGAGLAIAAVGVALGTAMAAVFPFPFHL